MEEKKLISLLNRISYSKKQQFINKLNQIKNVQFNQIVDSRDQFWLECWTEFGTLFENKPKDSFYLDAKSLVEKEIQKAAYSKEWSMY